MKNILCVIGFIATLGAFADIQIIDGVKYECKDGMCMPIFDEGTVDEVSATPAEVPAAEVGETRLAQGYMGVDDFISFLRGVEPAEGILAGKGIWLVLLLVMLGGIATNLTPCVLPLVPINLMIIGRSAVRGMWYGAGMMTAYGIMGVLAAVGGMAFGEIHGSPWFNGAIAVVFVLMALALFDVFFVDFSRFRKAGDTLGKRAKAPCLYAFGMGAMAAVLAGACVAPILIAVLVLTADLFASGNWFALGLPFVLGLGMALPWPFVGAGLRVLPKPGMWMKKVNKFFGVIVLCFAAWYGYLAVRACGALEPDGLAEGAISATPATIAEVLASAKRPVLVDCWASWCKNCAAMERTTLRNERVVETLKEMDFTVIKLQAEDIRALKAVKGFEGVLGLPAFVVFQ